MQPYAIFMIPYATCCPKPNTSKPGIYFGHFVALPVDSF